MELRWYRKSDRNEFRSPPTTAALVATAFSKKVVEAFLARFFRVDRFFEARFIPFGSLPFVNVAT